MMTAADAAAARVAIGAGTSSFDGAFGSLSGKPTTLSGYGITDAQPLDADLTAIAALTTTTYGRSLLTGADAAETRTTLGLGTLATQSGTFSGTSSGTNTGDQTITLTGDVTGSGTGSFATTIGAGKVTNAMLAGSIAASKLVGTDIATVGTVTAGTLSTGAVIGGVTMTLGSDATGDVYYRNSGGVLTRLAIGTSGQVLTVSGGLPSWAAASGGGGSPGGSSGQVQYNNAGAFGGTAAVTYATTGTHVVVAAQGATIVPGCFQGAASQSANLTEWKNSGGTTLASVDSSGNVTCKNVVASGAGISLDGVGGDVIFRRAGTLAMTIGNGVVYCNSNVVSFAAFKVSGGTGSGTPGTIIVEGNYARGGSDTNVSGGNGIVRGGAGTGNATASKVQLAVPIPTTSGTTAQTHRTVLELDGSTTAGDTSMLLWDVSAGSLKRVSIGASDSGGTGFKLLRVPN